MAFWGKIPYVIGFGLRAVAADGPKETSDPISEAEGTHPREAARQNRGLFLLCAAETAHT